MENPSAYSRAKEKNGPAPATVGFADISMSNNRLSLVQWGQEVKPRATVPRDWAPHSFIFLSCVSVRTETQLSRTLPEDVDVTERC